MIENARLDQLPPALVALREHVLAAMVNGEAETITVAQIFDLMAGAAPGHLDSIEELAAALGDDENFAATITAALALKASKADTDINPLTAKTTPVDTDAFRIWDSAASAFKKLSFVNLKAWVLALFNASGSAPVYACRAWVNFNGNTTPPTIRGSGNVSSVVRNGTGDYTINFTKSLPDEHFATLANADATSPNTVVSIGNAPTDSSCRVFVVSAGVLANNNNIHVAVFR